MWHVQVSTKHLTHIMLFNLHKNLERLVLLPPLHMSGTLMFHEIEPLFQGHS